MAVEVTDPKTIEVANLTPPEVAEDLSFLEELTSTPAIESPPSEKPEAKTESTTSPVNVPEPAQTKTKSTHPQELIDAARELGIEDRHIEATSSDALLSFVVKSRLRESELAAAKVRLPEVQQPVSEDEDEAVIDYLDKEVGADKKLISLMRKQAKRLKELEAVRVSSEQREAARTIKSGEDAIDTAFENMPAKMKKLFGSGDLRGMPDGPAKAKRLAVFRSAGVDFNSDTPATITRKINRAAQEIYGDLVQEAVNGGAYELPNGKEKKPTPEEWDRGGLAKPSGNPKRDQTLLAKVQDWYRENQVHSGARNDDEFDGLPE